MIDAPYQFFHSSWIQDPAFGGLVALGVFVSPNRTFPKLLKSRSVNYFVVSLFWPVYGIWIVLGSHHPTEGGDRPVHLIGQYV